MRIPTGGIIKDRKPPISSGIKPDDDLISAVPINVTTGWPGKIAVEEFQSRRMIILSGTGAREYYRTEFGYSLEGDYMGKSLYPQD